MDMGNGTSKEEQLYQAVQTGNVRVVKALQHDGTSLEVRVVLKFRKNYSGISAA